MCNTKLTSSILPQDFYVPDNGQHGLTVLFVTSFTKTDWQETQKMTEYLEPRITALELKRYQCPKDIAVDDSMRRARSHVEELGLYSANWKWVPEPYYTWSLEQRAQLLGAQSTHMLCKSLLLENKKVTEKPDLEDSQTNPQFLLVVLQ